MDICEVDLSVCFLSEALSCHQIVGRNSWQVKHDKLVSSIDFGIKIIWALDSNTAYSFSSCEIYWK